MLKLLNLLLKMLIVVGYYELKKALVLLKLLNLLLKLLILLLKLLIVLGYFVLLRALVLLKLLNL